MFYGVLVEMKLLIGSIILRYKIRVFYKWIFGANKTLVEIVTEGAFGGTYFKDIYSSVTGKWYKIMKRI